mgnify:CR=1 FL=1
MTKKRKRQKPKKQRVIEAATRFTELIIPNAEDSDAIDRAIDALANRLPVYPTDAAIFDAWCKCIQDSITHVTECYNVSREDIQKFMASQD